jgi:hypothetical protein
MVRPAVYSTTILGACSPTPIFCYFETVLREHAVAWWPAVAFEFSRE